MTQNASDRRVFCFVLLCACYWSLLGFVFFLAGFAPGYGSPLRYAWILLGLAVLTCLAYELSMLSVFLLCKKAIHTPSRFLNDSSAIDWSAPGFRVAVLSPLHRECRTPEDRASLVERLTEFAEASPYTWLDIWLSFDSPVEHEAEERQAYHQLRRSISKKFCGDRGPGACIHEFRSNRHKKVGNVASWCRAHGYKYKYVFIIDADSSIKCQSDDPADLRVLEKLISIMEQNPSVALAQASLLIRDTGTMGGWLQMAGQQIGYRFHAMVRRFLLDHQMEFYGHSALIRTDAYLSCVIEGGHAWNYLSHDMIEATDLNRAGWMTIQVPEVQTYELTEEMLPGWAQRDLRWSAGNWEWATFLGKQWSSLPTGPRLYLSLGVLAYAWPALWACWVVASVFLIREQRILFIGQYAEAATFFLLANTLIGLIGAKLVTVHSVHEARNMFALALLGLLSAPYQALIQGMNFALRAPVFRTWKRSPRTSGETWRSLAVETIRNTWPSALLGTWGLFVVQSCQAHSFLITTTLLSWALAPITAFILSLSSSQSEQVEMSRDACAYASQVQLQTA